MYAIVKSGVYLQDIYFVKGLDKAKKLLVDKVNADRDEYHVWDLALVSEYLSIDNWPVLYSLKKPVNDNYLKYDREVVGINPKHYYTVLVQDLVLMETEDDRSL